MNDEENEQEQQEQNTLEKKLIDEGKNAVKQGTKMGTKKLTARIAAGVLAHAIPIIAGALVFILVFTFIGSVFFSIQDAINEKVSNINDNIKLAVKITDDGIVVNPKQLLQNINDQLETLGLQKEGLYLGNERQADAYLYKYMIASLSTQLPYIEDKNATLKKIKDIASYVSPITYILNSLDQDQEVQGIVKIKRCTADSTTAKELEYLPYGKSSTEDSSTDDSSTDDSSTDDSSTEENNEQVIAESTTEENEKKTFSQLIEEDSSEALNYFSIDENWMLCVAKYQEVTVSGASTERTYTIDEVKIPYQTMIQNYSIPFSFFLTLQQMTQNPEYVSAVADMVMDDGDIEVVLYDTEETITSEYTCEYNLMTREWVEVPVQTGDGSNENGENTGTDNGEGGNSEGGTNPTPNTNPSPTPGGFNGPTVSDRASIKRIATATTIVNDGAGGGTSTSSTTDAPNAGESEGESEGASGETSEGTTTGESNETTLELKTTSQSVKETTITTTKTNTITANVTKANVWVISHTAEYEKDNPVPEHPLGEEGAKTGPTSENPPAEGQEGTWKEDIYETTKETNIKKGWKLKGSSNTKIEPDEFLGMWKNKWGIYTDSAKLLSLDLSFDPNGILVKYSLPKQSNGKEESSEESSEELVEGETETAQRDIKSSSPAEVLLSGKEMFLNVLENREGTQTHAKIMRELMNYYEARNMGKDYEINIDLSIFDVDEFTGVALYGSSTAKDFIHYFEGTPKQTADGTQYVVFDDGYGNLTVGWGIYIKSNKARFAVRGINADTLKVGSTVNKLIVDSIEDEIIEEDRNYIIQVVRGIGLEEYQIDALTSRVYNCGKNGGMNGFVQAYTQYGNTDALYTNLLSKPVTSDGKYSAGLEKRRKAEWDLFHTGYYINTNSYYSSQSASSSSIVDKAKQCHDYVRTNGYTYAQSGQNIPITSNSKKTIDCSSFVSWVLYEAGFSQFAGYQKTSSYFASNPMNWEKVSKENLQPGDIMVFSGHVQIYAGNGSYYNCGSNGSIKAQAPSSNGKSANDSSFLFGLRPN